MKRAVVLFLFLFLSAPFLTCLAQTGEADAIVGTWLTQDKDAKVEIIRRAGKYFGKLVWIKEANDEQGKPKTDKENPNKALRSKPLLGLEMLRDFVYDEDLVWNDGEIYDPTNGKSYSCTMRLNKDKKVMKLRGYIGISLFGRTQTWTRAD